ncbi:MAG: hypothetical protein AAB909_01830 [Patescibacteria group bacterium]
MELGVRYAMVGVEDSLNGRINMAAWRSKQAGVDVTRLMGRCVVNPAGIGEPDWGNLVAGEICDDGFPFNRETVVWSANEEIPLEDPRVVEIDGVLVCGLTALVRSAGEKSFGAYPAMARLEEDGDRITICDLQVFEGLGRGKNTTPVGGDLFMYRRNEDAHALTMVRHQGGLAQVEGEVPFVAIPAWGEHRMGTGMPPIWSEDGSWATMVVHGMTYDPGRCYYTYSIGRGFLERNGAGWQVRVCPDALFRGEDFKGWDQLHPELRLAIYNTGGVVMGSILRLFLNVGDRCTIVRDAPLEEMWKKW